MAENAPARKRGQGGAPAAERGRTTLTPGRAAHNGCWKGKRLSSEARRSSPRPAPGGHRVRDEHTPARTREPHLALRITIQLPSQLMDTGVMGRTQRQEVRQHRQALLGRPLHVVDVGDASTRTTREAASPVTTLDFDPLRFGGITLQRLLVEAGSVGCVVRQCEVAVAGQTSGRFGGYRAGPLDRRPSEPVAMEKPVQVDVHNHRSASRSASRLRTGSWSVGGLADFHQGIRAPALESFVLGIARGRVVVAASPVP